MRGIDVFTNRANPHLPQLICATNQEWRTHLTQQTDWTSSSSRTDIIYIYKFSTFPITYKFTATTSTDTEPLSNPLIGEKNTVHKQPRSDFLIKSVAERMLTSTITLLRLISTLNVTNTVIGTTCLCNSFAIPMYTSFGLQAPPFNSWANSFL